MMLVTASSQFHFLLVDWSVCLSFPKFHCFKLVFNKSWRQVGDLLDQLITCLLSVGPQLSAFKLVTEDEVRRLLSAMPAKSSPFDVLPRRLLKSCVDVFAPIVARLAYLSLQTGKFPSCYKRAQVLPLLKKAGLDASSPANYRPISNLATISKVLERLVWHACALIY